MRGATGEIAKIERDLAERGFEMVREREGRHRIWKHPVLGVVIVPKAHGSADPRAAKNLRAQIKRKVNGHA